MCMERPKITEFCKWLKLSLLENITLRLFFYVRLCLAIKKMREKAYQRSKISETSVMYQRGWGARVIPKYVGS